MKTPRQLLIEQHCTADAQLAQIQAQALQKALGPARLGDVHQTTRFMWFCRQFWQEVIRPSRPVWLGFVAVWLVILATRFQDAASMPKTAKGAPSAAEALQEWKDRQRLAAELANPGIIYQSDPAKTIAPAPRSEHRKTCLIG